MAIEKMTGYNDITSGNPNPKTLVPGYELANQATSDALYPLVYAEESLSLRLAEDVFSRVQQGVRKGRVSGHIPYSGALGVNTLRFIEVDEKLSLRDYGIELQKRTTEQEKNWIFQMVQADIANGFLDTSDAIAVISTMNAKQAMSLLAYRVKKQKKELQKNQLETIKANNDGSVQAAQVAAQLQNQQKQMDYDHELKKIQIETQKEIAIAQMKIESQERIALSNDQAKTSVAEITGQAKIVSNEITGIHQQHKQIIANQKQEKAEA